MIGSISPKLAHVPRLIYL
ncbi:hypothetical protein ZEAMMB73_Zm00001d048107 [Zea mays]|uniref:Uncharacterized protein n=1 Tax=Zea mays TaxID=4577 RepID=A0A1D6PHK0_MAIZE|nr:hypothetical protein ZEAMMB73_Zm00001d048107 [Zea mays]